MNLSFPASQLNGSIVIVKRAATHGLESETTIEAKFFGAREVCGLLNHISWTVYHIYKSFPHIKTYALLL